MPKKLSQEEFIERCKKKHNNYYSYDKTVYTGMSNDDYIIVTCPIHGDFKQLAAGHIRGKGCKDCAGTGKVGGSGSGFDPASDQTISGAWSFTNTAGHISYSQAQPETDVPPVVQSLKK